MERLFELGLLIKALERELDRQANEAMRPLGLTAPQADALIVIGQAGPLGLKDLGSLLIAEAGHPSRLVERLVDAGLVAREQSRDDRRRVGLKLTAKGRRLEQRVRRVRADLFGLAQEAVGDRDVSGLVAVLRELVGHTAYAELVRRRTELGSGIDR